MKTTELLSKIEEYAPLSLSGDYCKKYGCYDNSGIIVDCGKDFNGVLFTLDLTPQAVERAISLGYGCIVTHHPAIFGGVKNLTVTQSTLSQSILKCIRHDISIISMHLNMDVAPDGIDENLMKALGGNQAEIIQPLPVGGYGRLYDVVEQTAQEFEKNAQAMLNTRHTFLYDTGRKIRKAISFCGAGSSDATVAVALQRNADVFISADMKHHHILELVQSGICVLQLTHYASENYSFECIYNNIKNGLGIPSVYDTVGIML